MGCTLIILMIIIIVNCLKVRVNNEVFTNDGRWLINIVNDLNLCTMFIEDDITILLPEMLHKR